MTFYNRNKTCTQFYTFLEYYLSTLRNVENVSIHNSVRITVSYVNKNGVCIHKIHKCVNVFYPLQVDDFLLDIGTDYYLNSELDILDEVQMIEVYHEDICNEDKDF